MEGSADTRRIKSGDGCPPAVIMLKVAPRSDETGAAGTTAKYSAPARVCGTLMDTRPPAAVAMAETVKSCAFGAYGFAQPLALDAPGSHRYAAGSSAPPMQASSVTRTSTGVTAPPVGSRYNSNASRMLLPKRDGKGATAPAMSSHRMTVGLSPPPPPPCPCAMTRTGAAHVAGGAHAGGAKTLTKRRHTQAEGEEGSLQGRGHPLLKGRSVGTLDHGATWPDAARGREEEGPGVAASGAH